MSNKQIREIRTLSRDELEKRIRETERVLFDSKFKKISGQLENLKSPWLFRKNLARMKMVLSEGTKRV